MGCYFYSFEGGCPGRESGFDMTRRRIGRVLGMVSWSGCLNESCSTVGLNWIWTLGGCPGRICLLSYGFQKSSGHGILVSGVFAGMPGRLVRVHVRLICFVSGSFPLALNR